MACAYTAKKPQVVNFFANNPFTKILGFWLAGLLAAFYIPWLFVIFIICWVLSGILVLNRIKTKTYPFDLYFSVFLAFGFILAAFLSVTNQKAEYLSDHRIHRFLATITECPEEKTNSFQCQVKIECCDTACLNNQTVLIYFEKSETARQLQPGDQIMVKNRLQQIQNTGEPFAFNYQKFMSSRGIFYRCYLPSRNYIKLKDGKTGSIILQAEKFRLSLITLLKKRITSDEALQVISALTLGYRKDLTDEMKSYFASTGAMHVLAVSGLHVGMIYLFLSRIFSFLKRNKPGKILFLMVIACLLWSYALITGFSPSVQRATVMFSFILAGNSLNRTASIYNSIAASAFILLLFNPKLIHEVGFQLSYSAVISIVFFFPRFEKIFLPKNKFLKVMWQLLCVSLAAQLGVFALSIYYFHQFPVYFWLSNFLVVPAAYFILGLTFLSFIISPFARAATIVGKVLSAITLCTIFLLRKIDQLPFSLIENLSISTTQLFCLTAIGICTVFFIRLKRKVCFFLMNSFVLLFLLTGLIVKIQYFNQKKLIYYAHNQRIHLINGRKNYLIYRAGDLIRNQKEPAAIRKLQLKPPIFICLDSCQHYYSEDLMIANHIIRFLGQTFQYGDLKQTRHRQVNDLNPQESETRVSGENNNILNLKDIFASKSFTIDLKADNRMIPKLNSGTEDGKQIK